MHRIAQRGGELFQMCAVIAVANQSEMQIRVVGMGLGEGVQEHPQAFDGR